MKPGLMDTINKRYFQPNGAPIFEHFLKPELTALSEGSATVTMLAGPGHRNAMGMIHGGILAAVADLAMGVACLTYDRLVVTSEIHLSYIKNTPEGHPVTAIATVLNNGKTLIRAQCSILDDMGRLLVTALGTYFVLENGDVSTQ